MSFLNSLMTRFTLGALILLAAVVAMSQAHQYALEFQRDLSLWQANADALSQDVREYGQLADHYKDNAPRDFESYERDVKVFYQQFQQSTSALGSAHQDASAALTRVTANPLFAWLEPEQGPAAEALASQRQVQQQWLMFADYLMERMGPLDEPRLEWAAEAVIESNPEMLAATDRLSRQVSAGTAWFRDELALLNNALLCAVIGLLVLGFLGFAVTVIRPVVKTARACEQVARGDYGMAIQPNGAGETRQLQLAFNELSARAELMLGLVGELNRAGTTEQKMQRMLDSGRYALGINWIGFMAIGDDSVELVKSVPASADLDWRHRRVSIHKTLGKQLAAVNRDEWLDIDNLAELALKHHDERFLRELHKHTRSTHVMGYGFVCNHGNRLLLLFSTDHQDGFSTHQQELMRALSRLMADAIVVSLDEPAPETLDLPDTLRLA